MLSVRQLSPADAAELLRDVAAGAGMSPSRWEHGCTAGKFLAFTAQRDETPVGLAVASSTPRRLRVVGLAGEGEVAGLLLDHVVRAAGERDVTVWCPAGYAGLRSLLLRRGFLRVGQSDPGEPLAFLYRLSRNEGA
jgi:hypothetical protein